MLNGEATVFRRNYYINGSHAGVIVYLTDPVANNNDVEKLKKSLKDARGNGAFKTCLSTRRAGKRRPANYAVQPWRRRMSLPASKTPPATTC